MDISAGILGRNRIVLGTPESSFSGFGIWKCSSQGSKKSFTLNVEGAAWTRRSSGEEKPFKSRRSWNRRSEKYMKPFSIDVYISSRYVHAKVVHRVTSRTVAVATTGSKELRNSLLSLNGIGACEVIGKLIAERAKEADVYAVAYEPRKIRRLEDKLTAVLNVVEQNGVAVLYSA